MRLYFLLCVALTSAGCSSQAWREAGDRALVASPALIAGVVAGLQDDQDFDDALVRSFAAAAPTVLPSVLSPLIASAINESPALERRIASSLETIAVGIQEALEGNKDFGKTALALALKESPRLISEAVQEYAGAEVLEIVQPAIDQSFAAAESQSSADLYKALGAIATAVVGFAARNTLSGRAKEKTKADLGATREELAALKEKVSVILEKTA